MLQEHSKHEDAPASDMVPCDEPQAGTKLRRGELGGRCGRGGGRDFSWGRGGVSSSNLGEDEVSIIGANDMGSPGQVSVSGGRPGRGG